MSPSQYDIDAIAYSIAEWADSVFPDRTDASMFLKLYSEIGEMIEGDGGVDGEEFADVMILMLDYAVRKKINPSKAIKAKMTINRNREWKKNSVGAYSHVEEPLRVQHDAGNRSSDAPAVGKALAHDRNNPNPNPCRTHGECFTTGPHDCPYRSCDVLPSTDGGPRVACTRPVRVVSGGHPDTHEARYGGYDSTGISSVNAYPLAADSEGGEP